MSTFQPSEHSYGAYAGAARWKHISLKYSSLVLTSAMEKFLDALDPLLPFDIVITSGLRTPAGQASVMLSKIRAGEDLYKLYRSQPDLVKEVMDAKSSASAATAAIQKQVNRGRYLSDHMRGNAVDVRSSNLTTAQGNKLMTLARQLGVKPVDERSAPWGPHIHIEDVGGLTMLEHIQHRPGRTLLWIWLGTGVATAAILGGLFWFKRSRS